VRGRREGVVVVEEEGKEKQERGSTRWRPTGARKINSQPASSFRRQLNGKSSEHWVKP